MEDGRGRLVVQCAEASPGSCLRHMCVGEVGDARAFE